MASTPARDDASEPAAGPHVEYTDTLLLQLRPQYARRLREKKTTPAALRKKLGLGPLVDVLPKREGLRVGPEQMRWRAARLTEARSPDDVREAVFRAITRASDEIAFAEPDLRYQLVLPPEWEAEHPARAAKRLGDLWHLERVNAPAAWKAFGGEANAGKGIVVAHLDTGYRGEHEVVDALVQQKRLRWAQGIDFVDGKADAIDPLAHPGNPMFQPGHGTGTLSLLAARFANDRGRRYLGVAPGVDVVPVRVGRSVIQFGTKAIGDGIFYSVARGADVVTLSMGGLPSHYWASAVNEAYTSGTAIVAAAGNHIPLLGGLIRFPITQVVWPAAFARAIAVSGIMKQDERYRFDDRLSGNDGPEVNIAAPTPDVPCAKAGTTNGYQMGEGTSSATPQVAGALAMWLGKHGKGIKGWARVENARRALLLSAQKRGAEPYTAVAGPGRRTRNDWFGDGCLDCAKALTIGPVDASKLMQKPVADERLAVLELLLGDDLGGLLL